MRVRGVPLVAAAHLVRKRVDGDPVPLRVSTFRSNPGVGDEPDLEVGVRCDDDADVPSFDHRVALLAEGALAFAHHLADLGVPGDDRDGRVDHRLSDRRVTSCPAIETALPAEPDRVFPRQHHERGHVVEGDPASQRQPRQRPVHGPRVEVAETRAAPRARVRPSSCRPRRDRRSR